MNHVVHNLMEEFGSERFPQLEPLALELQGNEAALQHDTLPSGVERFYLHLRPPYIAGKGMRSLLAFAVHLPKSLKALRRLADEQNIQAFNLHFPGLEAFSFVVLKRLGLFRGRVILSMHGSDIRSAHQGTKTYKFFAKWILRMADSVVACSDGLKEEVTMLEPRATVRTIYNGIDLARFAGGSDGLFVWPFDAANRPVIVNVSAFEYRKGQDILLKAFQQVLERHADCVLVLVGKPGPQSDMVRQFIAEERLGSSVFIMENVPYRNMYALLRSSTLFVLATRWRKGVMGEGFALALLEAGAAQLPVVATASCGVEEMIYTGETGLVTPLEDPAALASGICEMLEHPSQARTMGEKLQLLVRDRFRWDTAAHEYARLAGLDEAAQLEKKVSEVSRA